MIAITLVCFTVAIASLGLANMYTEVDGISIISHGMYIVPQNETALIEKMEQYAVEDYRYFVARDGTNVNRCKLEGTVITVRYDTPLSLTWMMRIDTMKFEEQVLIDTITVTLPDHPDSSKKLHTCIVVDGPELGKGLVTLDLPPEHEAELRELAGLPQRISE